jgi:nitrite reductase/ring-hydroxylating ferredoxin subunit
VAWRSTGVRESELGPGLRAVEIEGRPVVLVRLSGAVHALAGACTHIGGDLADGTVTDGRVVCALHGATFDLKTGGVLTDPFGVEPPEGAVEPLERYRVRLVDGTVEVDLTDHPGP